MKDAKKWIWTFSEEKNELIFIQCGFSWCDSWRISTLPILHWSAHQASGENRRTARTFLSPSLSSWHKSRKHLTLRLNDRLPNQNRTHGYPIGYLNRIRLSCSLLHSPRLGSRIVRVLEDRKQDSIDAKRWLYHSRCKGHSGLLLLRTGNGVSQAGSKNLCHVTLMVVAEYCWIAKHQITSILEQVCCV